MAHLLCGVGTHEHHGPGAVALLCSGLENPKEDSGPLLQLGRRKHPQTEGAHTAYYVSTPHAAQLLGVIGQRRVQRLRSLQARHFKDHLHIGLTNQQVHRHIQLFQVCNKVPSMPMMARAVHAFKPKDFIPRAYSRTNTKFRES